MDGVELYYAWASRVNSRMGQISVPVFSPSKQVLQKGLHVCDIPHPCPLSVLRRIKARLVEGS